MIDSIFSLFEDEMMYTDSTAVASKVWLYFYTCPLFYYYFYTMV